MISSRLKDMRKKSLWFVTGRSLRMYMIYTIYTCPHSSHSHLLYPPEHDQVAGGVTSPSHSFASTWVSSSFSIRLDFAPIAPPG